MIRVKVEAGCQIGLHLHEGKWELHEVLEGSGELSESTLEKESALIATLEKLIHRLGYDTVFLDLDKNNAIIVTQEFLENHYMENV